MSKRTSATSAALKVAGMITSAGAAALGGVGALAYAQARRAAGTADEREQSFWVDGHVGDADPNARRVVWLGDSLAAGLGAVSPELTLPRLVARGSKRPTKLHSYATPGATSDDVVRDQLPALEQLRHGLGQVGVRIDAIGITVGANDIAAFTPRRRFKENLRKIIAAGERTPMTFVSIPHLGDAIRLPHPLRALASTRARWLDSALRTVTHEFDHVHYASVRERPPWIRKEHRAHFLSADRFHPSGAGYAIWADRVAEAFEKALTPAPAPSPDTA